MKTLASMLNTFGIGMVVLAVIAIAAEDDRWLAVFGSMAAAAFVAAWLISRRAPSSPSREAVATGDVRDCGYCASSIPASARRCPHCAGEFFDCPRCKDLVAVKTSQKVVGLARGGRADVRRCLRCGTHVEGPRF